MLSRVMSGERIRVVDGVVFARDAEDLGRLLQDDLAQGRRAWVFAETLSDADPAVVAVFALWGPSRVLKGLYFDEADARGAKRDDWTVELLPVK